MFTYTQDLLPFNQCFLCGQNSCRYFWMSVSTWLLAVPKNCNCSRVHIQKMSFHVVNVYVWISSTHEFVPFGLWIWSAYRWNSLLTLRKSLRSAKQHNFLRLFQSRCKKKSLTGIIPFSLTLAALTSKHSAINSSTEFNNPPILLTDEAYSNKH